MTVIQEIKDIYLRSFSMVKYNMVLTLPFLLFWLILGIVLIPLTSAGGGSVVYTLSLLACLIAAFISGWFNMFKKCVGMSVDENAPDDKRTSDSFYLFKEFFPGVGKYFTKIILGILMIFFLYSILMLLLESIVIPMLGTFDTFSQQEMADSLRNTKDATEYWKGLSSSDQSKMLNIAGIELVSSLLFGYITLFWAQLVVLKEIYPLAALIESVKLIKKDPARTFIVFLSSVVLLSAMIFIGALFALNPLIKLVFILLFVYSLIFVVMMTFLYLEKYGEIETGFNTN